MAASSSPPLAHHFPIERELRLLDELLSRQWRDLPLGLPPGPIQRELAERVDQIVKLPYDERVTRLLHPAATDWHFRFAEEARAAFFQDREVPGDRLLSELREIWTSISSGEAPDSCAAPGTPFRVTSTAAWALRCLLGDSREVAADKTFEPVAQDEPRFLHDLQEAVELIADTWPETWGEIERTVQFIVPFKSRGRDSFTRGRTLGAVYLSWRPGDALWLAEMLVHEARHNAG